ncbi:MAG TPA: cyclic nucleotide-binding domain-containing protein [Actinomycetota bacterium]|nr:cyclic nucleotide-binding domain-containing protein [Actinomycetota bacterium]
MSEQQAPLQPAGVFAGCTDDELRSIAAIGEPVSFEADTPIVEEGDRGDAMYVVVDGEARVDVGGRYHVLKPGEFFGEMALIAPGKRLATVRAVTPVRTLRIPADAFQAFVLDHPHVALSMMKTLVVRLREVEQRIDAWMA